MKKFLRKILNRLNYDIVKLSFSGTEKFKKNSAFEWLNFYDTATGKYFLPKYIKKDLVANHLKSGLYFEPEVIDIAKSFIKDGTAVLDVGANYGQMSICFSKLTPAGRVFSFEAEPFVLEILQKNIEVNNCSNVTVVAGAVYNETGKQLFFPEPDFKRFDSYGAYGIDPKATTGRTVNSITIDSLNIQEQISFMKVDIQGSDLFALQGAKNTILKNKMPILFEYEEQFQNEFNTIFNDYVEFVKNINYKFERIITGVNYLIVPND